MNKPTLLQPYLNFNGNAREALEFYQSVLGGKLEVTTFADMPTEGMPEEQKDKVMHAVLNNETLSFMASDAMAGSKVSFNDSISLSLMGDNEEQLTAFFNGLSAGGAIVTPLAKQAWGDVFGMFTDKFGVHWMVNISAAKQ